MSCEKRVTIILNLTNQSGWEGVLEQKRQRADLERAKYWAMQVAQDYGTLPYKHSPSIDITAPSHSRP